jgi:hypothetical protein
MDMNDIIRILNEDFMRELEATLIYARELIHHDRLCVQ